MKVLFLATWFPYPADNGSKIRISNLLTALASRHQVTLLAFARSPDAPAHLPQARQLCARVELSPWREFDPTNLTALAGYLHPKPRSVVATYSPQMQTLVASEISSHPDYQAVVASELPMAEYLRVCQHLPLLLDDLELGYLFGGEPLRFLSLRKLTQLKMRRYVQQLLKKVQACTVVSARERQIVAAIAPWFHPVQIIPNCIDLQQYDIGPVAVKPASLIYTGALHYSANFEAVNFFIHDVLPFITAAMPGVEFCVTGRMDGVAIPPSWQREGVRLLGYVPDVRPLIAASAVCVAPLLSGSGTRLKILEAFALGTPVVSTSKGAEGLDAQPGQHLLIADSAQAFADAVVSLLKRPEERRRLAISAREFVSDRYDWSKVQAEFLELVAALPDLAKRQRGRESS